jgi:hypothetical protein
VKIQKFHLALWNGRFFDEIFLKNLIYPFFSSICKEKVFIPAGEKKWKIYIL